MKKLAVVVMSLCFTVSCASNSVSDKVADSEAAPKQEQKAEKKARSSRNCRPQQTGSRLSRC